MINLELPSDPEIPFLGIYARGIKTSVHTKTCTRVFTAALFIIDKVETNQMSIN